MLKQSVFAIFLTFCTFQCAFCDTIQLKDKSAIVGTVVAEKRDQVAVDVGYTILLVSRNEIVKISKNDASVPPPRPASSQKSSASDSKHAADSKVASESRSGFYSAPSKALPSRTVRELVNQLGEAVVQVRTPSGLGSGFIINEDGFLVTNFHVIEGETQISVAVYHLRDGQLEPKVYKQVRIVAVNKFQDIARLKIDDKDVPKFKYVLLGSADALSVGE